MKPVRTDTARRRLTHAGIVAAALGLLLFLYSVKRAGVASVIDGITRPGAGFVLILLLSAVRQVIRTVTWTMCVEGPVRLGLREAFVAFVIGDALGNLTPLGLALSEPSKAMLVRNRMPFLSAFSALAVENFFYTLAVVLVIVTGTVAFLHAFDVPRAVRLASLVTLAGTLIVAGLLLWIVGTRVKLASGIVEQLSRQRVGRRTLLLVLERVRALEERIYGFSARNRARLLPLASLEIGFHVAAVAEVYVTLMLIGVPATLLTAFVLEYVNRVITVVFKFVPLRLGVDEAGTGLATQVLGLGSAPGVAIAIIRKARVMCWTALGVSFLVRRGLSLQTALTEAEALASARGPRGA